MWRSSPRKHEWVNRDCTATDSIPKQTGYAMYMAASCLGKMQKCFWLSSLLFTTISTAYNHSYPIFCSFLFIKSHPNLHHRWGTVSELDFYRVWHRILANIFIWDCNPCFSDSSALYFTEISTEMSELYLFQIRSSRFQCHIAIFGLCDTDISFGYLSLKFEMSIAHSFLQRFLWKKMRWCQKRKGYK